jgi:mercuric ion binding protein
MNKLMKFSFALLAVVFSLASCSETTAQTKEVTQEVVGNSEMTMTIEGMTCAMGCARAIEVELNNIEGVEAAKVNFEAANATLIYNGSLTSESSIVDFVNNYKNGSYKALASKKACCASKEKACSPEEKAKCEASKKSCSEAEKVACEKSAKKACCASKEKPCCAK